MRDREGGWIVVVSGRKEDQREVETLTGEHNGSGISAKCVLQQPSKRRISVRDEPPAWPALRKG